MGACVVGFLVMGADEGLHVSVRIDGAGERGTFVFCLSCLGNDSCVGACVGSSVGTRVGGPEGCTVGTEVTTLRSSVH